MNRRRLSWACITVSIVLGGLGVLTEPLSPRTQLLAAGVALAGFAVFVAAEWRRSVRLSGERARRLKEQPR